MNHTRWGAVILSLTILASVSLSASPNPGARLLIMNENINGPNVVSIYRLDPGISSLTLLRRVQTGGTGLGTGYLALSSIVTVPNGTGACAFASDNGSNDIAAFDWPTSKSISKVGNYIDPEGQSGEDGLGLAAGNGYLFAGYTGSANIGVWQIGSDCSLTLLSNAGNRNNRAVNGMKVTPDGKTLVVSYLLSVDSYSINDGILTENGAYVSSNTGSGVEITADGKYAIFGDESNNTEIDIYAIEPNGGLGTELTFGLNDNLGPGRNAENIALSPNGKLIYASDNDSGQITTLRFTEKPLNVSYISITNLKSRTGTVPLPGQILTASSSHNGAWLYVADGVHRASGLGLLQINQDGTTSEVPNSPFPTQHASARIGIAVYPFPTF